MTKKTLLLLGGSEAQLVAISKAIKLGFRTVLCDYLPNNPGRLAVDAFYQVSTTDKEAVLRVAQNEVIDGIIAYGSDPAAPTAAYVAEKLGLPGIPYETARSFCEKGRFREWLQVHGFNVPTSVVLRDADSTNSIQGLRFPVIVKPDDSSGSKGVSVLHGVDDFGSAVDYARSYSRDGIVVVEEFIERDHQHVIEAEIFVVNGEVRSWCLMNTIRDAETNPLLPAAYTYPLQIGREREMLVRSEVSRLIREAGIRYGACNIEMIIDSNDRLYFLDAGPRNGGNRLSEFVELVGGKDIVAATLSAAMGDYGDIDVELDGANSFCGLAVLHSAESGVFAGVQYSDAAAGALCKEYLDVLPGDLVSPFDVCTDLVGLSFFKFCDEQSMRAVMENSREHMRVVLEL